MTVKTMYVKALLGETYKEIAEQTSRTEVAVRSAIQRYYTKRGLPSPTAYMSMESNEQALALLALEEDEPMDIPSTIPSYSKMFNDGDMEIQQVINATHAQLQDKAFLLEKLGLNPDQWDIKEASLSKWGTEDDFRTSVRVRVSPKKLEVDYEILIDLLKESLTTVEPPKSVYLKPPEGQEANLVIPLFDLHTQKSEQHLSYKMFGEINRVVSQRTYDNIVIIFGGDGLEHDNFVSTTEQGTRTEDTAIELDYMVLFHQLMVTAQLACAQAKEVHFIYLRGNHSPSLDWALTHGLMYATSEHKNISFDLDKDELVKAVKFDNVFIGMFHGQKQFKKDQLVPQFISKFPVDWAESSTRTIFSGHFHTEKETIYDLVSATWQQQPSPKNPNVWAKQNNFDSHFIGVKLYTFNKDSITKIDYISVK